MTMIRTPPPSPNLPTGFGARSDSNGRAAQKAEAEVETVSSSLRINTPSRSAIRTESCPISPVSESKSEGYAGVSSLDCLLADMKLYPYLCKTIGQNLLAKASLDFLANPNLKLSSFPIGHGSYSCVFKILNRERSVLKFAVSKKRSNIILKEAGFLSQLNEINQLNHNNRYNIVPFYGITYIYKSHYKRLRSNEFVPGIVLEEYEMNLQQFCQNKNETIFTNWWKLCFQMLDCLSFLKAERIIHGDIKTANILVDSKLNFFLADFTAAKRLNDGNFIIGSSLESTMEYCASEMIEFSKQSFDTDLYALGLCLLALITKCEPFHELQQSKNHGIGSIQQSQWLITAILKNDPIHFNILNNDHLYQLWHKELEFLKIILISRQPVENCIPLRPHLSFANDS